MRFSSRLLALILALILGLGAAAQPSDALYDQARLADLLERQGSSGGALPLAPEDVPYASYVLDHPSGNSVIARHALYHEVGGGRRGAWARAAHPHPPPRRTGPDLPRPRGHPRPPRRAGPLRP